ncbi:MULTISPECIES: CHAP domain-containing protein [Actinosynnema]|uniref:CHAP domain-containing protein n=1 Tax=Actinosynnema TaxID=40566 RepID=UPI0020A5317A|nr:CHAP domain-containing protein [Actinosynnema pretiosum]MCP2093182.1 hypothetical protein [Actinosynnema pretiosum]
MSRRGVRAALGAVLASAALLGAVAVPAQAAPGELEQWRVRQEIVDKAMAEVGQRESGPELYPERYQQVDSAVMRPAQWCGVFVNWAWTVGGVKDRPAMRPAPGSSGLDQGHWATYWQKWARENGKWRDISERNVEMGDVVVFGQYPSMFAHVGLVVEVRYDDSGLKATHVRTVEGNYGDRVAYTRWRKIDGLSAGFGRPASGFVSPF